jgi:hypothetical protein
MRPTRFTLPVAALLLLGACDYFGGTEQEATGDASGEVLTGSLSDEMIPTQDLKSQPPSLAVQPGEGGPSGDGADSASVDSAAVDGETAPAEEAAPAEAVEE